MGHRFSLSFSCARGHRYSPVVRMATGWATLGLSDENRSFLELQAPGTQNRKLALCVTWCNRHQRWLSSPLANAAALAPPGASFGTAYKGCYTNCSDATGDTSCGSRQGAPDLEHLATLTGWRLWTTCGWAPTGPASRTRGSVLRRWRGQASVDIPFGLGNGACTWTRAIPGRRCSTHRPAVRIFNTYPIPFAKHVRVAVELLTTVPAATGPRTWLPWVISGWSSSRHAAARLHRLAAGVGEAARGGEQRGGRGRDADAPARRHGRDQRVPDGVLSVSAPTYIGFLEAASGAHAPRRARCGCCWRARGLLPRDVLPTRATTPTCSPA